MNRVGNMFLWVALICGLPIFFTLLITLLTFTCLPPESLKIQIQDSHNGVAYITTVYLKPTTQHLANRFLPVYGVSYNDTIKKPKYIKRNMASKMLGRFTMYQDASSRSAVVLFHKTNKLNGVVGQKYLLINLSFDQLSSALVVNRSVTIASDQYINELITYDSASIPTYKPITGGPEIIYNEIMVVVGYQIYQDHFIEKSERSPDASPVEALLIHLIAHFNAVDMLYSTFSSPKVKLNIAKVVVEEMKNAFPFRPNPVTIGRRKFYDVENLLTVLSKYFAEGYMRSWRNTYDQILYLTNRPSSYKGRPLHDGLLDIFYFGICYNFFFFIGKGLIIYENMRIPQPAIAIPFKSPYTSYAQSARTMAQIFAKNPPRKFILSGEDSEGIPKKTLTWSPNCAVEIQKFFRMGRQCRYLNYPRSLKNMLRPKITFNKYEQCLCREFHITLSEGEWNKNDNCTHMACGTATADKAIYPMDGTTCGTNKVCWDNKCVSLT